MWHFDVKESLDRHNPTFFERAILPSPVRPDSASESIDEARQHPSCIGNSGIYFPVYILHSAPGNLHWTFDMLLALLSILVREKNGTGQVALRLCGIHLENQR